MPLRTNILTVCFSGLSVLYASILVAAYAPSSLDVIRGIPLGARLASEQLTIDDLRWKSYDAEDLDFGMTISPATNVVFTIPGDSPDIRRDVLLGYNGDKIRYWGYCFDETYAYDQSQPITASGFPGHLFLSEAERAWRDLRLKQKQTLYSIYVLPTKQDLEPKANGAIRHQLETFKAGSTCYIMTEKQLALGTDRDNDGLNTQMEKGEGTDADNPDTDSDGIFDGIEALMLFSDPLRRDSDGDGLIDGIEDKNKNGVKEIGETDALKKDTDSDGLCDGYCREYRESRTCGDNLGRDCKDLVYGRWMGEDKNLNGKIDTGETDPRLWSTDQNGISDMQKYFKCILAGGKNC